MTFMPRGLADRHYTEFTLASSKSAFKDSDVTTHNPEFYFQWPYSNAKYDEEMHCNIISIQSKNIQYYNYLYN